MMTNHVPFGDERFSRQRMRWSEAEPALEKMLLTQAAANGIELIRNEEVRLDCKTPDGTVLSFLVFWPSGQQRINILAPDRTREH